MLVPLDCSEDPYLDFFGSGSGFFRRIGSGSRKFFLSEDSIMELAFFLRKGPDFFFFKLNPDLDSFSEGTDPVVSRGSDSNRFLIPDPVYSKDKTAQQYFYKNID